MTIPPIAPQNLTLPQQIAAHAGLYTLPVGSDGLQYAQHRQMLEQMDRLNRTRQIISETFFRPVSNTLITAQGLPYNPFSVSSVMMGGMQIMTQYSQLRYQAQAMMGREFLAGQFGANDNRLTGMTQFLENRGFNKVDLLQTMQALAESTGEISQNLADASKNVLTFARATGQNAGVFVQAFGSASRGTALPTGEDADFRRLQRAVQLSGNNPALLGSTFAAISSFQEISRQAGVLPSEVRDASGRSTGTENAEQFLARMQAVNPRLYQERQDLAVSHGMQMMGVGRGPLLGIAMEIARRTNRGGQGGPLTFRHILSDIDSGADYMQQGLQQFLSRNPALLDQFALSGALPSGLAVSLGENPDAANVRFRPDASTLPGKYQSRSALDDSAGRDTAPRDKTVATMVNAFASETGKFADAVRAFDAAVQKIASNPALLGAASLGGSTLGTVTSLLANFGVGYLGGRAASGALTGAVVRAGLATAARTAIGAAVTTMSAPVVIGGAALLGAGYLGYKILQDNDGDAPSDESAQPDTSDATATSSGRPESVMTRTPRVSADSVLGIGATSSAVRQRRDAALARARSVDPYQSWGKQMRSARPGYGTASPSALDERLNPFVTLIRQSLGSRFHLTSTVRDEARNQSLPGSVPNSLHMEGLAFDFQSDASGYRYVQNLVQQYGGQAILHGNGANRHMHVEFTNDQASRLVEEMQRMVVETRMRGMSQHGRRQTGALP